MADQCEPYQSTEYWTSHHDWADGRQLSHGVTFHDTTFRDGEQQPGVVFTEEDKVELGKLCSDLGIGRIETRLPLVSDADRGAIRRLANEGLDADVYAFTRCLSGS